MTEAGERPGHWLDDFYDVYPRLEDEFRTVLDASLAPRGPDYLYAVAGSLGLAAGSIIVDAGCGEGEHSLQLARRFGWRVYGVDPVQHHIDQANALLQREDASLRGRVAFHHGSAERLPFADARIDLIWCREVLYHVELDEALREFRRVLTPNGRVLIYQLFGTERLEPREAQWLWNTARVVPRNADAHAMEAAFAAAGFSIAEMIDLGSEPAEWAEESSGKASRELRAAARLLRDPQRYVEQFGNPAYDIKLADALWHIYRMIGKLANRVYVLAPA